MTYLAGAADWFCAGATVIEKGRRDSTLPRRRSSQYDRNIFNIVDCVDCLGGGESRPDPL